MIPIYVEAVKININIKGVAKDGAEIDKFGKLDLLFFDRQNGEVVARLMMDPYTARQIADLMLSASEQVVGKIHEPKEAKKIEYTG